MYENEHLQYRVHMISEPCWSGCTGYCIHCIRNVYVQSLDDFVSFDAKREPAFFYRDLSSTKKEKIPLVFKNNVAQLPKSTAFKITESDYETKVSKEAIKTFTFFNFSNFKDCQSLWNWISN
jgi:hypothetical protein